MGIGFDNIAVGSNGLIGAGGAYSWSHTVVTTGANIYADFEADRATTLSNITCGGTAMTFVGTLTFGASNAQIVRYKFVSAAAGTYTISANSSVAIFSSGSSISYTGVLNEAANQTATGTTTALSQSATCTAGQVILQSFAGRTSTANGCTLTSLSGGTNRYNTGSSATALVINEAGVSTTFTATGGGGGGFVDWGALATPFNPSQGPGFGATGGWTGPVLPANPFVGPMALRHQKRWPYVSSRNTGLQAPVLFDASGTGYNQAVVGTTGTWTHQANQGAYVVVALSGFINVATNGGFSGVTFGGQPMTRLYDNYNNSIPANGPLTFYGMANAPAGPQTVQFTTVSTGAFVTANSFSYTGVGSVSPFQWPAYNSSASLSQTITNNVANGLVFQAFATNSLALTNLTGGNIRYNQTATPATTNVAALAVQDSSASGSITFTATPSGSAAWCGMGLIFSPNAWPTVSTPPFNAALAKFNSQQNVTIQIIGDSTSFGYLDGLSLSGWVGRLGIILGNYYDYNVSIKQYSGTTYGAPTTLRTSPRGGAAPTLLIYNGGIVGALLINDLGYISLNNQIVATSDVVFVGDGINEAINGYNAEEYVGLFGIELGYITNIYCPNIPVIVTTENPLGNGVGGGTNYAVDQPILVSFLSALAQNLVGSSVPMGAALVQGPYNVSMLDTQQAFVNQYQASIMADGAHPNQFGYLIQAIWMASILAAWTVTAIGASCPPVQIANPRVGPVTLRRQKRMPYISSLVLSAVGQLTATGTLSGTVRPKAPAVLSATTRLSATVTPLITAALAASARLTVTSKPTAGVALTATTHLTSTARPKANAALAATTRLTVTALQSVPARLTATTRLAATVQPKVNAALSVTARLGGAAVLLPGGNPATVNIATAAATAVTSNVATVNTLNYPATGTTA